jgi:septal ring factor EnvC (AmiA/AmiB activator)
MTDSNPRNGVPQWVGQLCVGLCAVVAASSISWWQGASTSLSKDQKEQQILGAKIVAELQACRDLIREVSTTVRDGEQTNNTQNAKLSALEARVSILESRSRPHSPN